MRKNRRWPGVKPAARELGVSYEHLLMCIKGIRRSRSLMQRYRALAADQTKMTGAVNRPGPNRNHRNAWNTKQYETELETVN